MRVATRTMGPCPLPGPIQNDDGIPDPLAVPHSWFYTNKRWYTGVWVKGRDHPIPEHPNPKPDHGAIPFYLVLSKALMLQKPASSGFPPCWVLYKGRVASRIMGGRPPYLVLCKMGVASRIMVPSPPSSSPSGSSGYPPCLVSF